MTVLSEKFTKDIDESVKAVTDNRPLARPLKINTAAQEGKKDFTSDFSSFINEAVESVVNDKSIVSQPVINEELIDFQPVVTVTPSSVMSLLKKGTPTLQSYMESLTKEESSETLRMLKLEQVEDNVLSITSVDSDNMNTTIEGALEKVLPTQIEGIKGFITRLAASESSNNYKAKNKEGYVGLLQLGKQRLSDFNKDNKTKFSMEEFRNSEDIQDRVNIWHVRDIDRVYDEKSINIPRNAFRAVAHLGGINGAIKYVQSKGKYNPADSMGTKLSSYAEKFGGKI
tara:strand:+ start:1870 stop:2724 length:855 start_codon:yes stop_codon:yes gene_type:complete